VDSFGARMAWARSYVERRADLTQLGRIANQLDPLLSPEFGGRP
jgi:hypothetical protein